METQSQSPEIEYFPLWTEGGWTKERLINFEAEIGPRAFDRGFRHRAYSDEDREFSEADIVKCFHNQARIADVVQKDWPRYIGVDLSGEKRPGNVIFILANSPVGVRYPVEILFGNWKSPETAKILIDAIERHNPMKVKVENNGYQESIIEWCREIYRNDKEKEKATKLIEGFLTGKQKADPEVGIPSLAVEFHNEAWFMAMGDGRHEFDCKCGLCEFRKDLRAYPQGDDGRKFDHLMAAWFAREGAREKRKAERKISVEAW